MKHRWVFHVAHLSSLHISVFLLHSNIFIIQEKKEHLPHWYQILKSKVLVDSHFWLFMTPWLKGAHQAPLSLGFSRQEYWSGLPFPSTEDFPDPGMEPRSPSLQADSVPDSKIPGKDSDWPSRSYAYYWTCDELLWWARCKSCACPRATVMGTVQVMCLSLGIGKQICGQMKGGISYLAHNRPYIQWHCSGQIFTFLSGDFNVNNLLRFLPPCVSRAHFSFSFFHFLSLFFFCHSKQHVESQFPNQGLNPHALHRKPRVLTTGMPGKSRGHIFHMVFFSLLLFIFIFCFRLFFFQLPF